jgi:uncharacterized protein
MSINKVIIIFGIFLAIFAAFVVYQFNGQGQMKPNASVTVNKQTFAVEKITDAKAQEIGLTKYNSIKPEQGMLFIFDKSGSHPFWMRGMKFPIDMIFINDKTVVATYENLPAAKITDPNIPTYGGDGLSDKVLEINAGLVTKYNIKKGDTITITDKK